MINIGELDESTRLYAHILENQKELNECFNPIFDFIYDMMLYKLYVTYKKLTDNNVAVYGVNTDCLLVMETKETLSNIVNFSNVIGEFKFEHNKSNCNTRINLENNEFLKIEHQKINNIILDNEYDMGNVREKIKNINRVYILGDWAGAGKTYMATKLNDRTLCFSI